MVEHRLEHLLSLAITQRATDIHLHFSKQAIVVQFRTIKGLQRKNEELVDESLYHYLKYLANLDLTSTLVPQSGSFTYIVDEIEYYCRFSALETLFIKSGVIRILNLTLIENVHELGEPKDILKALGQQFQQKSGLILFAGKTGSGKTTSMFTALQQCQHQSIYTIEDPIEIHYDAFMQVQINLKTGLTYEAVVKQLLRHDPDILALGEIRSAQEAKALIRCSLAGHLVCSTIHSANLHSTFARLLDFEVSIYDLMMLDITLVYQQLKVKEDHRYAHFQLLGNTEIQAYLQTLAR